MKTAPQIALNVATSWMSSALSAISGIILVPILLKAVGKEGYGVIALATLVVSLSLVLDLGLSGALTRHLAAEIARKNLRRFQELFVTGLACYLSIGLVGSVICFVFAGPIVHLINIPPRWVGDAFFLVRYYASLMFVVSVASGAYTAVLASHNRYDLWQSIDSLFALLQSITLIVAIYFLGGRLKAWGSIMAGIELLRLVAIVFAVNRLRPGLRLSLGLLRRDSLGLLLSLGPRLFLLKLTYLIGTMSDPIVLTRCLGAGAVGLYNSGVTLSRRMGPFIDALINQLNPLAASKAALGDQGKIVEILLRGTRYRLLMGGLACVVFMTFAADIAHVWLGRSLGPYELGAVTMIMMWWAAVDFLSYCGGSQWAVLIGLNKTNFLVLLTVPTAMLNLLASILLVKYTNLGIIGVIIPTLVVSLIQRPVTALYCARLLNIPLGDYFSRAYLRPFVMLVLLMGLALLLRFWIHPRTFITLAACLLAVSLAWLPLCWFIGFRPEDRQTFAHLFFGVRERLAVLIS